MATTGSFDLNLTKLGNTTNNSTEIVEKVTEEVANNGDIIGLGIAFSIGLTLIFGVVFMVLNFLPALIGKLKGLKSA